MTPSGLSAAGYYYEKNHQAQASKQHLQYTSRLQQHNSRQSSEPVTYEKEYFFFSAPEEDSLETKALERQINSYKKRQQVIFIRTPMNAAHEKILEHFLRDSVEKPTHIYIFSQRPNFEGVIKKLHNYSRNTHPKPEVHFVKYRNPSELQTIQSSIMGEIGAASEDKPIYAPPPASDNKPVSKNYAMNFLPTDIDVVPGSSYIPLFLL